jgi:hypothetical protein
VEFETLSCCRISSAGSLLLRIPEAAKLTCVSKRKERGEDGELRRSGRIILKIEMKQLQQVGFADTRGAKLALENCTKKTTILEAAQIIPVNRSASIEFGILAHHFSV